MIHQVQKLLLRFGIVSTIRVKKSGIMKIYEKTYKTLPCYEVNIRQNKSINDFYRLIGFNINRKQDNLIKLIARIYSNLHYIKCDTCKYKIYKDLFISLTI